MNIWLVRTDGIVLADSGRLVCFLSVTLSAINPAAREYPPIAKSIAIVLAPAFS
jgi:hypothetical protein